MIEILKNVETLDKVLLLLLLISILLKVIKKIVIIILQYKINKDGANDNIPCKYKVKDIVKPNRFICKNYFFKKNWKRGTCDQKKCDGYQNPRMNFEEEISSNLLGTIFLELMDFLGNISTFILLVRTLLN